LKVSELSTKLEDAMQFIDLANSKYEEVITKLNSHEIARIEIQEENKILKSALQQTESQLLQLKNSYNDLEQYSRRECVEIQGIPAPDHPTKESTNIKNEGQLTKLLS
jgi:chromosome segregation ATPase